MKALAAFAFVCFFLLPGIAAGDHALHRLAVQISDDNPEKMNAALDIAANVSRHYSGLGEEVEIEIVAMNDGLLMLRADTSPIKARLEQFRKSMPNVSFKACGNTVETMTRAEGKPIPLLPETGVVSTGVAYLMQLAEHGWFVLRP